MTDRKTMYFFLSCLTTISAKKKHELLRAFGDVESLFSATREEIAFSGVPLSDMQVSEFDALRDEKTLKNLIRKTKECGASFLSEEESAFPEKLREIEDAPTGIFYRGSLPDRESKSVAIVGSRRCSAYGRDCALFFAETLASHGVDIISGMALGIDGYAARGALSGGGKTFAVLGCGVDRCYPLENLDLYRSLQERGGILSERPVGYTPKAYDFPYRNRLISALSDVTLVVEASERSGSLVTADYALKQNRDVFAVPGRISDAMSYGTNRLIRDGAFAATCPEDVLGFLSIASGIGAVRPPSVTLTKEESVVFGFVSAEEKCVEELIRDTSFPVSELLSVLVRLEIKGIVEKTGSGSYRKRIR